MLRKKSPSLRPMACQIPDILVSWTLDVSFLVSFLSSRSSDLSPYCFLGLTRRDIHGAAMGGLPDQTARPDRGHTILRHRLKIALVFDLVFLRFLVDLGLQDGSKNH